MVLHEETSPGYVCECVFAWLFWAAPLGILRRVVSVLLVMPPRGRLRAIGAGAVTWPCQESWSNRQENERWP